MIHFWNLRIQYKKICIQCKNLWLTGWFIHSATTSSSYAFNIAWAAVCFLESSTVAGRVFKTLCSVTFNKSSSKWARRDLAHFIRPYRQKWWKKSSNIEEILTGNRRKKSWYRWIIFLFLIHLNYSFNFFLAVFKDSLVFFIHFGQRNFLTNLKKRTRFCIYKSALSSKFSQICLTALN